MKKLVIAFLLLAVFLGGCIYTVDPRDLQGKPNNPAGSLVSPDSNSASQTGASVVLAIQEVAKHNTANDCWMIIDSKVYDLTSYYGHPGGDSLYVPYCGRDGSIAFHTKDSRGIDHSQEALSLLATFKLGSLNQAIIAPSANNVSSGNPAQNRNSNPKNSEDDEEDEDD